MNEPYATELVVLAIITLGVSLFLPFSTRYRLAWGACQGVAFALLAVPVGQLAVFRTLDWRGIADFAAGSALLFRLRQYLRVVRKPIITSPP